MEVYVGLDVALKRSAVCVMAGDGRVVWQELVDTHPELIAGHLAAWNGQVVRIGLETGATTPWLARSFKTFGLPVVVMDARRVSDALKARPCKTDKADAGALADVLV